MWASRLQFFSSWLLTIVGRKTTNRTPTTFSATSKTKTLLAGRTSNNICCNKRTRSFWSKAYFWRSIAWSVSRASPATKVTRASRLKLKMSFGTSHNTTIWAGTRVPPIRAWLHFTPKFSKDWLVRMSDTRFLVWERSRVWFKLLNLKLTRKESRFTKLSRSSSP